MQDKKSTQKRPIETTQLSYYRPKIMIAGNDPGPFPEIKRFVYKPN